MGLYFKKNHAAFLNQGMRKTVTIESLLATHDQPFIVIDQSLKIVAVNQSYESCFEVAGKELIGKPCCSAIEALAETSNSKCRHLRFFRDIEAYGYCNSKISSRGSFNCIRVRGFPLVDGNGEIFLGESIANASTLTRDTNHSTMVGESPEFQFLLKKLQQASATDASVLLTGETGTGKELAAEYIHNHSVRRNKEFVVVDCTVLAGELFETELFGHEKGAFTGATTIKKGLLELADGGTLFLDEIGELPLSQQPKLLRILESGTFRRVGGLKPLASDARIVCATHRDLTELVEAEVFRDDLYYRLSVFPIHLPPLRDRSTDIPLLADTLTRKIGSTIGKPYRLTEKALDCLRSHSFPGNIRELRNTLQLASALSQNGMIDVDHIHLRAKRQWNGVERRVIFNSPVDSREYQRSPLENVEARYIQYLLDKHQGSRKKVAFEMNVSERTLYRKLKRLNMNRKVDAELT